MRTQSQRFYLALSGLPGTNLNAIGVGLTICRQGRIPAHRNRAWRKGTADSVPDSFSRISGKTFDVRISGIFAFMCSHFAGFRCVQYFFYCGGSGCNMLGNTDFFGDVSDRNRHDICICNVDFFCHTWIPG